MDMLGPNIEDHVTNCVVYGISFCSASYNVDSGSGAVYMLNVLV